MSKKNEDSVEQFFRKATAQQDNTFMQRDWEKMEKLLDAEAAKVTVARFQRIKRAIFTGTVITGFVTLVYFLVNTQQHPESRLLTDGLLQEQAVAGEEAPTTKPGKEYPSTAALLPKTQLKSTESLNDLTTQNTNAHEVDMTNDQKKTRAHLGTPDTQSVVLDSDLPGLSRQATLIGAEQSTKSQVIHRDGEGPIQANDPVEKEFHLVEMIPEVVTHAEQENEQMPEKGERQNNTAFSRWNIAISFAPDFSTTELDRYSAPGDAFGITAGFNITRRVSITTGVLKTSKQYEGYGSEYQPPAGYWERRTNGIVPDEVKGNCTVLEFPVNIQYQLNNGVRNKWFAAVGISSYYMLDEAYHYQFEEPNPGAAASWSSDEPSSYAFSVGQVSAAYERQLSPSISIGIEPFLKIPFAGIGWTNIELFTTGAYFNVRYRFSRIKTATP
jgi:hypothetical protein